MSVLQTPQKIRSMADLVARLGGVPLDRIRFHPPPGTATIQDVIDARGRKEPRCELIEGVLVEKPMSVEASQLALFLGALLLPHVRSGNLGIMTDAQGSLEIMAGLVRVPDLAFISWGRMPGRRRPPQPIPNLVPDLVVEVLSPSNTPAEMAARRADYFTAGSILFWEVDPVSRTVVVYTSPTQSQLLTVGDVLDGSPLLPGFTLTLTDLFDELDRHG